MTSAQVVLAHAVGSHPWHPGELERVAALLVGPAIFWIMSGRRADDLSVPELVVALAPQIQQRSPRKRSARRGA